MADEKPAKKPAAAKEPKAEKAPKKEAAPKAKTAKKGAAPAPEAKAEPVAEPKKEKRAKAPQPKLAPIADRRAAAEAARAKAMPAAKQPKTDKKVKITQIGSPIGRQDYQLATLKGLGLNRRHRSRVLEDTPAVRGMIARVHHLVRVESIT